MTTSEQHARAAGATDADFARPATYGDLLRYVDLLAGEIKKLKARTTEVEGKGVVYRGAWKAAEEYQRGNLTTHAGSMWHANTDTRDRPGTSDDWTLAVKGGER